MPLKKDPPAPRHSHARGGTLQGGHGTSLRTGPKGGVLPRAAAVTAALCAVAHVTTLAGSAAPGRATGLSLLLAVGCLVCAVHLWHRPGARAWTAHAGLAAAMLASHPLTAAVPALRTRDTEPATT